MGNRMREQFGLNAVPNGQQRQIQVDLSKAAQRSCACGCQYFQHALTVHTVSALLSPTGQELTAQVPVLICMECKAVLPMGPKEKGQ